MTAIDGQLVTFDGALLHIDAAAKPLDISKQLAVPYLVDLELPERTWDRCVPRCEQEQPAFDSGDTSVQQPVDERLS